MLLPERYYILTATPEPVLILAGFFVLILNTLFLQYHTCNFPCYSTCSIQLSHREEGFSPSNPGLSRAKCIGCTEWFKPESEALPYTASMAARMLNKR